MTRLKAFLDRQKITQRQLAEAIGLTESAVSLYVKGRRNPSLPVARRILAFARRVDPSASFEDLFGAAGDEPEVA